MPRHVLSVWPSFMPARHDTLTFKKWIYESMPIYAELAQNPMACTLLVALMMASLVLPRASKQDASTCMPAIQSENHAKVQGRNAARDIVLSRGMLFATNVSSTSLEQMQGCSVSWHKAASGPACIF